ncbi:MAG: IS630 family transposase, partial [Candidatus Acidiferrum sp.]
PWAVMHQHVTHNKCHATCGELADAILGFPREKVPKNRGKLRDSVTGSFRVISPKDFRVVT